MVSKKVTGGYLLRLDLGEEVVKSLAEFCEKQKIKSAWISGLGGITKAQIGYYNLKRKKYVFRHVRDVKELTNLTGNFNWIGTTPALHLHGTFTDSKNKAYGGHVREAEAGGTVEIYIQVWDTKLEREADPDIGLPLFKL